MLNLAMVLVSCLSLGQDWAFDPSERAKKWYETYVQEHHPRYRLAEWKERGWEGKEVEGVGKFFRRYEAKNETLKEHWKDLEENIWIDREGKCSIWKGDAADLQRILEALGERATDEAGVRRVGGICMSLSDKIVMAPERVEIQGRTFIHHQHLLTLLSGRVGTYREDQSFLFDAEGRLAAVKFTGIQDLTVADRERLLDEADPWMIVLGFGAEETVKRLEEKQKSKERKPPHHDR